MSSTNSGRYTASMPAAANAALCSGGLRLCATGLPTTPYTCSVIYGSS